MAARGRDDKNYDFEFEKWALSLIAAQPGNLSRKGADKGIDGNIFFGAKSEGRAIVSVKAGGGCDHSAAPIRPGGATGAGIALVREKDGKGTRGRAARSIGKTGRW